jgi:hypothetical protein
MFDFVYVLYLRLVLRKLSASSERKDARYEAELQMYTTRN